MCGVSGFASQPLPEHVGYSHSRHAHSLLGKWWRLDLLNESEGRCCLQILQGTVTHLAHVYPPMCGLSGFASQPLPEHVGNSQLRHAQSLLFL